MFEEVQQVVREAGTLALEYFNRVASIGVDSKGHLDMVTEADRKVEDLIGRRLRECYPQDGLFGEEGLSYASRSGRTWVIDPIDGTFNFLRGGDRWAVSIGLYENHKPCFGVVYSPIRNQFLVGGAGLGSTQNGAPLAKRSGLDRRIGACAIGFHPTVSLNEQLSTLHFILNDARMTFRNTGSATADLIDVANGVVDGYVGMGISTWDLMAILPILEDIGITTTLDWSAIELSQKVRFVCGTPEFIEVLTDAFRVNGHEVC